MRWESDRLARDLAEVEVIPAPKTHPSPLGRFDQFNEQGQIFAIVDLPVFPKDESAPDSDTITDQS